MRRFLVKKNAEPSTASNIDTNIGIASQCYGTGSTEAQEENTSDSDQKNKEKAGSHQSGRSGQSFQSRWTETYPWLKYDQTRSVAVCSLCISAVDNNLPLPSDSRGIRAKQAFVVSGYSQWNRALEAFKNHEKSEFHREAATGVNNMKKPTVVQAISIEKQKQMKEARIALQKIFHTVQVIAQEGLPLSGHDDDNSKFINLLKMRATDVPELKVWLERTSRKWLHHSIIEEILQLMLRSVLNKLVSEIRNENCFSILIDECADISHLEQVSIVLRFVDEKFEVREEFLGFYETKNAKAQTLFEIINDVLVRYNLKMMSIVGQCFDGAANMSGEISGLMAKIQEINPKALFVHCIAHRLNLVVQDALNKNLVNVRNFIGTIKELINFVRDSPQRLAIFTDFQESESNIMNKSLPSLSKFCPTRWCLRIKSLMTVMKNYEVIVEFFYNIYGNSNLDASVTSAAHGFIYKLESFEFFFYLHTLITVFEKIELLNKELQAKQLNIKESHEKIRVMKKLIKKDRDTGFDEIWRNATTKAVELGVDEPVLMRARKAPKRYDEGTSPHVFNSAEDYYRKEYFHILDVTLSSLEDRFKENNLTFLTKLEDFVTGKSSGEVAQEIVDFYREQFGSAFDGSRLELHRNMLLDMMKEKNVVPNCLCDVSKFCIANQTSIALVPGMKICLQIFLTLPVSTCTCERSFSALRRLKNYLRSSLSAQRLNEYAVLNIHKDITAILDLDELMNEWILRASPRLSTFFIPK